MENSSNGENFATKMATAKRAVSNIHVPTSVFETNSQRREQN